MRSKNRRRGFSLIELLIVIAIILIIAAIALPNLKTARMNALEMAAIKHITTINTGQTQYYSTFGKYATTLQALGPGQGDSTGGPDSAGVIPEDLASGEKGGYRFTLQATDHQFTLNADPVVFNSTGRRTFFCDESLTVRNNFGAEPADANSPPIQ
jgi:type IV pilus assembly protein PilA